LGPDVTGIARVKVPCDHLKLGMYVTELDRPWLDTPFLVQGFELRSLSDIEDLRKYCDFVYIDKELSSPKVFNQLQTLETAAGRVKPFAVARSKPAIKAEKPKRKTTYVDRSTWSDELELAKLAVDDVGSAFRDVIEASTRDAPLDLPRIRKSVTPMVDSVIRNPDACIWLTRIKSGSDYAYRHALGTSVWCVVLGRQLGMSRNDLNKLALGGLVLDIGKTRLDPELLNLPRKLDAEEMEQVRRHVQYGIEELKAHGDVHNDVLTMVAHHHERHDGSGYPQGLREGEIPVFARIASIADCYDALTNTRPYARPISPTEAIKVLYDFRDVDFQAEIIDEFIQAIGIYPAGTVVRLSTGEVGVVVSEARTSRLHPNIMLMTDAQGQPLVETREIELREYKDTDGKQVNIINSLEPDTVDVDLLTLGV